MIKLKIKYGNSQTDLRFPCTEKEMNAALERIHAEDVTPLEFYVSEVIFPEELGCLQDRFVDLDEVNFLGKRMDSFFGMDWPMTFVKDGVTPPDMNKEGDSSAASSADASAK